MKKLKISYTKGIYTFLKINAGLLGKDRQNFLGDDHRQRYFMVLEGLINQRLMILQQYLYQSNCQDSMRQFLPILYGLLCEHPREMLLHEGVKICIAFSGLKVLSLQQGKRDDDLQ